MRNNRILVVAPYFYPEGGGLEKYAYLTARGLRKNYNVVVISMTRKQEKIEELCGIRVYRIKPFLIISNTPISIRFILKMNQLIRESSFEHIIAHTPVPFAADVASFLGKLYKLPLRVVYHTVGLKKGFGFNLLDILSDMYSKTIERVTLRDVKITAVSHIVWKYLKERGYNSDVMYPPLGEMTDKRNLDKKKKVILFVGQLGRYHKFKNLDLLMHAFAKIYSTFPDWELWIVGGGDMIEEYKKMALNLGISKSVKFLGQVTDTNELRQIYSLASILVLPSSFESFGMVIPEALSNGTPVIISQQVGAGVLVDNMKNGLILDELSSTALSIALRTLIETPKLRKKMSRIAVSKVNSFSESSALKLLS